jgi:hypothetical protein
VVPEPADAHASAAGTLCRASCCGGTAAIRLVTRLERANSRLAKTSKRQTMARAGQHSLLKGVVACEGASCRLLRQVEILSTFSVYRSPQHRPTAALYRTTEV